MEFRILGPLEVIHDGHAVDVGGLKQRAVLALLLVDGNRVVSLDRLIDQLWGDEAPPRATGSLQAYISNLRRALEPGRPPRTPPSVLVTLPPGYVLRVADEDLDAARFQRLAVEGRRRLDEGRPADAYEALSTALALWRGPALADFSYHTFARTESARLDELRLTALEDRIEAEMALGRHAAAVAELEGMVKEQPLRERLWGMLMLALYRSGRQAEALRAFTAARTTLAEELGIDPGPALQRYEDEILRQSPSLDWQAPAEPVVVVAPRPEPVPPVEAPARAPAAAISASATPPGPRPEGVLVGRAEHLARLEGALAAVIAGRPRLMLISGEPGIGKTRLVEELAAKAEAGGAAVVWGRCYEGEGAPPFWPWVQALRAMVARTSPEELSTLLGRDGTTLAQLLPELPVSPGSQITDQGAARFQLYEAVATFLTGVATRSPIVVVIEDLHWADVASLRLFQFLAADVHQARVLILATFRDAEIAADHPLTEALADLARRPVTERMELAGLSRGDVAAYIDTATGIEVGEDVAGAIHERTDGNPFFVAELVRLLSSEHRLLTGPSPAGAMPVVPAGVRDVIRRRIARLPDDAQTLLTVAAVIGREFSIDVLVDACGLDDDRVLDLIETALVTRIVVEVPELVGRYRFAHALTRETLYEGLTPVRRARLHTQVGLALERHWSWNIDEHLPELAHHFTEAARVGQAEKAIEYTTRAAAAALAAHAYEDSAIQWERALAVVELSRPTDKVGRLELLTKVGSTRKRDGDVPGARKVLTAAADLARELGDATRFARVALTFGGGGWWGWWSDVTVVDQPAIDLLQEALDRLDPEDSKLRAAVTSMLAVVLYYSPEDERRERLAYEAIDMARRLGDQTTLAKSLLNCLVALWRPDNLDERMALADETVAAARACGHDAVENIARHFRAVAALEAGDIDTFRRLTGAIGAEVDKLDAASRAHVLSTECLIATMEGRFAEAEAMIKANYATSRRLSEIEAARTYMSQMSLLYRELGRNGELEEGNRRALEGDESRAAWRSSLALLLADNGRLDEAKAEFEIVAARDFVDTPKDATWSISMAMRSEIAYLVGDRRRAELLYDLLTPYDGRFVVLFTRILYGGSFSYYLGALATTLDRWDDAERHFSAAVAENEGLGALPFVARAKLRWAEMLLRRGDPADRDRATHLHVEGRALASSLGLGHTGGDVQIRPAEGGVLSTQSD